MNEEPNRKLFFSLYVAAEPSVRRFLRLLVHDDGIFDDVCQTVALRLWEVFDSYDETRAFDVWARGVAVKVVNEQRRFERRAGRLLGEKAIQSLIDGYDRIAESSSDLGDRARQLEALRQCLDKLRPRYRQLITKRYYESLSVDQVALQTNHSLQATYKALQRALKQVAECVRRRVLAGGAARSA